MPFQANVAGTVVNEPGGHVATQREVESPQPVDVHDPWVYRQQPA